MLKESDQQTYNLLSYLTAKLMQAAHESGVDGGGIILMVDREGRLANTVVAGSYELKERLDKLHLQVREAVTAGGFALSNEPLETMDMAHMAAMTSDDDDGDLH